jgi:hypothetical protein
MADQWVVVPGKFGRMSKAVSAPLKPKGGAAAHRPKDPAKEALKRRLYKAVDTLRRLLAEKECGADVRQMVAKLEARTMSSRIAMLADGCRGRSRAVSDADIDDLDEVMGWLDGVTDAHLLLDWARGVLWADLCVQYQASQKTLWRRIDRALDHILCHRVEGQHKIG